MKKFSISYLIFLIFYIALEVYFRDYAIGLLGQANILSYELNTFELLGRSVSALGFTVFFVSLFGEKISTTKKKVVFSGVMFFSFYFILHIIMNNIHLFVSEEKREDAYYLNLFKQGSYYMPRIEENLPIEKDFDDELFQTFYGLSSFLYFDNKTIINNVKKHESTYVDVVSKGQFDKDLVLRDIRYALFPTSIDNLKFMTAASLHYRDTSTLMWNEDMRRNLFSLAYYSYRNESFALTQRGFGVIPEHQRHSSIERSVRIIDQLRGRHRFLSNKRTDLIFINANRNKGEVDNLISLFNRYHGDVFEKLFKQIVDDMGTNHFRGKYYSFSDNYHLYPIREFNQDNFMRWRYFHTKNAYKNDFSDVMKEVFTGISERDLNDLVNVWLYSVNMYDFLNQEKLNHIYTTYSNNITQPRSFSVAFEKYERFSHNRIAPIYTDVSDYLRTHITMYNFLTESGFTNYSEHLFESFLVFQAEYIQNLKDDHKTNVKAALIPPLILFLLNLALILNFSMFVVKLIEIKFNNKVVSGAIYVSLVLILIIFLGSNKGINNDRYENFFNNYAHENMNINKERIAITNWFVRKNNFFNQYLSVGFNPVSSVADFLTIRHANKDIRTREYLFEVNLQLNKIKENKEKEQY